MLLDIPSTRLVGYGNKAFGCIHWMDTLECSYHCLTQLRSNAHLRHRCLMHISQYALKAKHRAVMDIYNLLLNCRPMC